MFLLNAKEYLRRVQVLDNIVENKLFELEQLEALATSITQRLNADRVQTSVNPDKMTDLIHKIIKKKEAINEAIDRYVDYKSEVIEVLEKLNGAEYDLLYRVYIRYMPLKEAAATSKRDMSYSNATTLHGRALKKVQNILNATKKEKT